MNYLFSRASWFYTDALIINLVFLIVYKKYTCSIMYAHIIIWLINIVLQVLPYRYQSLLYYQSNIIISIIVIIIITVTIPHMVVPYHQIPLLTCINAGLKLAVILIKQPIGISGSCCCCCCCCCGSCSYYVN